MQRIIYILILAFSFQFSVAQTSEKQRNLENQKARILKEIQNVRKLLQSEKSKEKNVLAEILEQNKKIELSKELIKNTQEQIQLISKELDKNQLEVDELLEELKDLKADYASTITKSYKSRSEQSRIMFILSSKDFVQGYKRIQYMKQYANFRKTQGEEIKEKSEDLQKLINGLEAKKRAQRNLLNDAQKETKELEIEQQKQQKLIALIKKDQRKYNDQIKKKQAESQAIDRQIKKLIRDAIAAANKKTAKTTGKKASNATFNLTPEGKVVANNFKASRGKLPWPVVKGYISLAYGDQPHPIQKHLTIHNSGVEITTETGANARSVFKGEVIQIQVLTGGNKAVLIQHGDYITVYHNLSKVVVKKGDKVNIKQNIGTIGKNSSGTTTLKFLLSHNANIHNPQSWLSRNN